MTRTPILSKLLRRLRLWFAMPDNASTELALINLLRETLDDVRALAARVGHLEHKIQHQHEKLMTALETLTASVQALHDGDAALTTAVNDAITHIGQPGATDAQLTTLAGVIDTKTASDAALVVALNAALNPTPPPTP